MKDPFSGDDSWEEAIGMNCRKTQIATAAFSGLVWEEYVTAMNHSG